jgi:hypothetical protein
MAVVLNQSIIDHFIAYQLPRRPEAMRSQKLDKQQETEPRRLVKRSVIALLLTAAVLSMVGSASLLTATVATAASAKRWLAEEPADGNVGQLYYNTTTDKEYIYNGEEWVPHDTSIDGYVLKSVQKSRQRDKTTSPGSTMPSAAARGGSGTEASPTNFCLDSNNNNLCPDAVHVKHQKFMNDCQGCHDLSGSFDVSAAFYKDSSKPAFIAGGAAPVYTPSGNWNTTPTTVSATCSNIACHNVTSGTFSYYFPGGDGEPELITVTTGGVSSATASWQDNSVTSCNSCHGNPPSGYTWHSGYHGGNIAGANNCEFCHPDAKSNTSNGIIISNVLTDPGLHKNGTINVLAKYTTRCFGCH